jgi:hypothetical protein
MFNWIRHAYDTVTGKIDSTVASWVHGLINGLYSFLHVIFGDVGKAWDDFWHDIDGFVTGIRHFIDSVGRALIDIYGWINKEGHLVYYYISNPIKLVDLVYDELLGKIEATAEDTAERLGKFALAFIYKNLKTFVTIVEDIFDAIF